MSQVVSPQCAFSVNSVCSVRDDFGLGLVRDAARLWGDEDVSHRVHRAHRGAEARGGEGHHWLLLRSPAAALRVAACLDNPQHPQSNQDSPTRQESARIWVRRRGPGAVGDRAANLPG